MHVKQGLPENDCPDGSTCSPFNTCCSLGSDDEWGEDLFACCPHEDGVCCNDFEGCCPQGHTCGDAETEGCIADLDAEEVPSDYLIPSNTPPTYVCELPKTQCPNSRCCGEGEKCLELPSGNYKCADQGLLGCTGGNFACPENLWCDESSGTTMCSEERDTDLSVKESLLKKFWGDDAAACSTLLLQRDAKTTLVGQPPPVGQVKAPVQLWYPKTLVPLSKAVATGPTQLPTVLAGRICQHVHATSVEVHDQDQCFISNLNGRFPRKQVSRVAELVSEYQRRLCKQQGCVVGSRGEYVYEAEELDPCPCREKPAMPVQTSAGGVDLDDAKFEAMADAQLAVGETMASVPTDTADEQPVHITMKPQGAPIIDDEEEPYRSATDAMWQAGQTQDGIATEALDIEMKAAFLPEPYMGKEGCSDSVDLDGAAAVNDDTKDEASRTEEVSLAQMNSEATTDESQMMLNGGK